MDRRVSGALDTAHLGGGRAGRWLALLPRCRKCGSCRPPGRDRGWWAGVVGRRGTCRLSIRHLSRLSEPDGGGWAVHDIGPRPRGVRLDGRDVSRRRAGVAVVRQGRWRRPDCRWCQRGSGTANRSHRRRPANRGGPTGGTWTDSDSRSWSGTGSHACPVAGTWSNSCSGACSGSRLRRQRPPRPRNPNRLLHLRRPRSPSRPQTRPAQSRAETGTETRSQA